MRLVLAKRALTPAPPPPAPVGPAALTSLVMVENTGAAQSSVVYRFGHAFRRGDVPAGWFATAWFAATQVPLQVDAKATWPDGSLMYAVLTIVAGNFTANQLKAIELRRSATGSSGTAITLADLPTDAAWNARIESGANGVTVDRTALQAASGLAIRQWLSGPHCSAWVYRVDIPGIPANRAQAQFVIYAYRAATSGAVTRLDVRGGVENCKMQLGGATADIASAANRLLVNAVEQFTSTAPLYPWTRWSRRGTNWLNVHVKHDMAYLMATGLLPRYDLALSTPTAAVNGYAALHSSVINAQGCARQPMNGGGVDPDIGILPGWDVSYFLGQNPGLLATVLGTHELFARHQTHNRDATTGEWFQIGTGVNQHQGLQTNFSPEFGRGTYWPVGGTNPQATYGTDMAHQPSIGYVPFLLTGDFWYLEEHLAWACTNSAWGENSWESTTIHSLMCADQIRAEGWGWRTLVTAAGICPDSHPLKQYLYDRITLNLNRLATYYGAGGASNTEVGNVNHYHPPNRAWIGFANLLPNWMDDFITMSVAWGRRLGFDGASGARPDMTWYADFKLKFPVQRVQVFGPACSQYWAEYGTSPLPFTWVDWEQRVYLNNNFATEAAWRPANTWGPYQDINALQNQPPNSAAWRAGWRNTVPAQTANAMTGFQDLPNSDIFIIRPCLTAAVDRGTPSASASWDAWLSYDHSQFSYDTATRGQPVYEPQYATLPTPAYAYPQLDPYLAAVPVGATWVNRTAGLAVNLTIHDQVTAFSGGQSAGGRLVIIGGGHNNSTWDGIASLEWRRYSTVGWQLNVRSTGDLLGVAEGAGGAATITAHIAARRTGGDIDGGFNDTLDNRGRHQISRHTYDAIAMRPDGSRCYWYGGSLTADWAGETRNWNYNHQDLFSYQFGAQAGSLLAAYGTIFAASSACTFDRRHGNRLWLLDPTGVYIYDVASGVRTLVTANTGTWGIESWLTFNEDLGTAGALAAGGSFGSTGWSEYDIATNTWGANRALPAGANTTVAKVFYVPAAFGADYGTYFCFAPNQGTLYRWTGSAWASIATGGPAILDYTYGRCGFDEVHKIFYLVDSFGAGGSWRTWIVRPYAFQP